MGILSVLAVVGLMVVVGACANSVKFPISTVTPAADIQTPPKTCAVP